MLLNTDPHFMAAKGYSSYGRAHKIMTAVAGPLQIKPLMIIVHRFFAMPDRSDFVVVAVLGISTEFLAAHLAGNNVYVTRGK